MNYKIDSFRESIIKTALESEKCAGFHSFSDLRSLFNKYVVFPGFADVHVHLREPGFLYKETIETATRAAAHGGYTAVCAMPNLNPVPDTKENLDLELEAIKKSALINVYPYGAITMGQDGRELSDMEDLAPFAAGFSDDGRGVQDDEVMFGAMKKAKRLGKIISAHCEDTSLLRGGCIHDGDYARRHGYRGICSESEWRQIERDIELVRKTGCKYHVCHISTKESVELLRHAKAEGLDITCETAPHYLLLDDSMLKDEGRFKMNPPIRSKADREALICGIQDGTIDMIATDHAPHSEKEKSGGLKDSLMGIVGLETAFPLMYTYFVKNKIISMERLTELMSINPAKRFSIPIGKGDFCVWDLNEEYLIDSKDFLSKGKSTPFEGFKVNGRCIMTICGGKAVYTDI